MENKEGPADILYVWIFLGQWGVSLGPIKQTVLTGGDFSSAGHPAIVVAIPHKHTYSIISSSFLSDTGLFSPCRCHLALYLQGMQQSFLFIFWLCQLGIITYNELHIRLLTLFLGDNRIQFHLRLPDPHRYLMSYSKPFLGKLHKMLVITEERCVLLLLLWRSFRETFKVGL